MSLAAIQAAWECNEEDPPARFVLVALADLTNEDGLCWPAVGTLASRTGLHKRTVQRALTGLVERKHISYAEDDRSRGGKPGMRSTTLYRVHPIPSPEALEKKEARRQAEPTIPGLLAEAKTTGGPLPGVADSHGRQTVTGDTESPHGRQTVTPRAADSHPTGGTESPDPYLIRNRSEKDPTTRGREAAASPDGPLLTEKGQWAMRIASAYPANGSQYAAEQSVLQALDEGQEPEAMLAMVQEHCRRFHQLPAEEQRYCPRKDRYFRDKRWTDNPNLAPWKNSEDLGPVRIEKKRGAPPDAEEAKMLAAARDMWPDMEPGTRWKDIPPRKQHAVQQHIGRKKRGAAA